MAQRRCEGIQRGIAILKWVSGLKFVIFTTFSFLKGYAIQGRSDIYYLDESVLLQTKPLVDSIRHSFRDASGVFSVWHA